MTDFLFLAQAYLQGLDYAIILLFFLVTLGIGVAVSKQAGKSTEDFFVGGRNMPWWLLGVSMVATTFSTDTPNLVTGLVRNDGVAGNWVWWAMLLSGMLTVFVFAKLWRRSGVLTDVEFYELRYSGKPASFLRGFRAIYLGMIFNVVVMGMVTLAAVKFGEVVLGIDGWITVVVCGVVVMAYSSLGGLKGVVLTDFVQFGLAMVGAVWAAIWVFQQPEVQGLEGLLNHPSLDGKLELFPNFDNPDSWIPLLLVPLAVVWWSSYYPGAEPGGGGYVAQRMFSAKDERNAVGATFFFNLAHYALRPWPWIIIALASLIFFPAKVGLSDKPYASKEALERVAHIGDKELGYLDQAIVAQLAAARADLEKEQAGKQRAHKLEAHQGKIDNLLRVQGIAQANPQDPEIMTLAFIVTERSTKDGELKLNKEDKPDWDDVLTSEGHVAMAIASPNVALTRLNADLGYPSMLTKLPSGLLGLIAASLLAAYMSTMSTQINLGASYVVNDFYGRFINTEASQKQLVSVGRMATVVMLALGGSLGLVLEGAPEVFGLLLLLGAGTGAIYILRWFWWRINAMTEIVAMIVSLCIALTFYLEGKGTITLVFLEGWEDWMKLTLSVALTTTSWILATFLTPADAKETLYSFYQKVKPGGPGWASVVARAKAEGVNLEDEQEGAWDVPLGLVCVVLGCVAIFGALLATGWWIYGQTTPALIATVLSVAAFAVVLPLSHKLSFR